MPGARSNTIVSAQVRDYIVIHRPQTYGTSGPNATAAQNTTAIQAAIDAAVADGGGTVWIDEPGTWPVGSAGANPYDAGTIYSFELDDDVTVYVGPGVTLQLPDDTQSGATQYYYMFIFRNKERLRFYGTGTLDCNSQGQSTYSGGYGQQLGGHINGYGTADGNHDIIVEDLTLINTFGNPCNIGSNTSLVNRRIYLRNLRCRVFGEGPQLSETEDFVFEGCTVDDTGNTARGDLYELSNCNDGVVRGNVALGDGTNSLAGSGLDLFGSKRVAVIGNVFDGVNNCVGMQNGNGGSIVDDITFSGNIFRNAREGISAFQTGVATFAGNIWQNVGAATALFQFLNTVSTSKTTFSGDKFQTSGTMIFSRGQVEFNGCEIDAGASAALYFAQVAGYTPTVRWAGGRINNRTSSGAAVSIVSIASTDFAPSVTISNADLTGNAGGVSTVVNSGSMRNVIFDNCIMSTTTDANRPPQSLGTIPVNGTLETTYTLMTTGRNKSLTTTRVLARVTAISGTPSVTLSVGSVAGSYVDVCPSQTLSPTVVGEVIALTLATGAGPAANSAILVNVTTGAATACKFQFSIEGEEQPEYYAAPTPTTTNVTSLVLFLPRESTYWQDTAGTTPAVIGDRVARWDTGMAGLPRASQSTAGARPVRQSIGLTNFDNTSIMTLVDSGGSATSVSLTGDFTAYFTGYITANSVIWAPVTNSTGTGGFIIAQGAGNIIFQTDAAQISVTFGTLGVTASGAFLFRFRRSSGAVTLSMTGRSTDYSLGTLTGTVTLNRVQNWIASMSSNTALRNGNIIVCNAALTHDGTEDTLIRNYLYESSAVRLY